MASGGIQELMAAENRASSIVQEARAARTERMKEAKIEAERHIEEFRKTKEEEFNAASAQSSGSSNTDFSELEKTTDKEIDDMRGQYQTNSQTVIQMLVDKVCGNVPLTVPEALHKREG
uniref:V-type proton ATPase subunit G n=1 Tax=Fibrocapsa japonica TaxID=94617 RepID=A0A7S2UYL7_9STRA|mmetsp:Transcript_20607/g.29824  ORF Transcript_20607/g.29824 Transcript_20607/m.29824 type:complete len:119 (+) Transcript_20607:126-482(+)|eukprot:CAMPEP_0113939668 /NCGR_PEP_ID=MMETSP1339-20121228/5943_1 /TAXON_ID=94617 /ORGANISM="Fibrocapsa japonica" /LENGTH=118 /DNA_ID=CAMNT_0000943255 /DNA_START=124 /DNA_END=480 /DNA_ORIENTATION=+ /assembly_acc=CAM_ASM_000762